MDNKIFLEVYGKRNDGQVVLPAKPPKHLVNIYQISSLTKNAGEEYKVEFIHRMDFWHQNLDYYTIITPDLLSQIALKVDVEQK